MRQSHCSPSVPQRSSPAPSLHSSPRALHRPPMSRSCSPATASFTSAANKRSSTTRRMWSVRCMSRSGYVTEAYGPQTLADGSSATRRYMQSARFKLWPQAHLHTQWPGTGDLEDPISTLMLSGFLPEMGDVAKQQATTRDALVALVDKIGPSIVMMHSMGGPAGWLVTDARPDAVKAVLAIEPNGPPVHTV